MSLSGWLERRADLAPDRIALVFEGRGTSYAALAAAARATAAMLRERHRIAAGDRVGFLGLNRPELLVLLFACARLGAMLVPLNWRLAVPEHLAILRDADAAVLIHEPAFEATADAVAAGLPTCERLALRPGDRLAGDGTTDDLGAAAMPVLLVYTSGTTGSPKGAVLTQDALFWNIVNATIMHDLSSADRVLTTLPLFHVGGLNVQTLPALHAGAAVHLQARFDPPAVLAAIAAERITLTVLVPAQLKALIEHPDWPSADLSSLRLVTTGSSIVPPHLVRPWQERGIDVIQVYGCTETAPIAIFQTPATARVNLVTCGKAAPHCQVRIVGPGGPVHAPEVRGEIEVSGPNIMREYWRQPEATAAALADGWFRTGDIGHVDADGFYYVDDRRKEVIISGGENIYPAEVEHVLADHPALVDVVVVGRPDPRWGEVPVAVVVPRPGAVVDAAALLRLYEGRLARFKHPRAVVVVDALPRNAMGKVLKQEVRAIVTGS